MSFSQKVEINGVDISSDVVGWKVFKSKDGPEDNRADITLSSTVFGSVSGFKVNMTLKVYKGEDASSLVKVFSGKIYKFDYSGGIVEVVGRDDFWSLQTTLISKSYDKNIDTEAGVISAIAEDLITTQGGLAASVTASGTVFTLDKFIANDDEIRERIYTCANILDWQVYWDDANEQVVFEPRGATLFSTDLTVGTNVQNIPRWDTDKSAMINKIKVKGAIRRDTPTESFNGDGAEDTFTVVSTPKDTEVTVDSVLQVRGVSNSTTSFDYIVDEDQQTIVFESGSIPGVGVANVVIKYTTDIPIPVIVKNTDSIDQFGLQETSQYFDDVKTVDDAVIRARNIINRLGVPFTKTSLQTIGVFTLKIGNAVNVIDTTQNKDVTLIVQNITYQYPEGFDIVNVGDKEFKLFDFISNTAQRIKELEKKELTNQGIFNQVLDFKRQFFLQRRYLKFQKLDTTGDGAWGQGFGDGSSVNNLAWLGTNALWQASFTNSAVDTAIIQGRNTYEELFYDEDFNDSGDATWSTANKRIDFTSGQNRVLGPISLGATHTFYNISTGTITGSLLIEVSADGKGTWETVTTGIRTAIASADTTGFYIRLTENNTSTARIESNINADGEIDVPGIKCVLEGG